MLDVRLAVKTGVEVEGRILLNSDAQGVEKGHHFRQGRLEQRGIMYVSWDIKD